jgi:hypothetical protein
MIMPTETLDTHLEMAVDAFEAAFRVARRAADRDPRPGIREKASDLASNLAMLHDRVNSVRTKGRNLAKALGNATITEVTEGRAA